MGFVGIPVYTIRVFISEMLVTGSRLLVFLGSDNHKHTEGSTRFCAGSGY